MQHRHNQFNSLVQLVCRIVMEQLTEMLFTNKMKFTKIFCSNKNLFIAASEPSSAEKAGLRRKATL